MPKQARQLDIHRPVLCDAAQRAGRLQDALGLVPDHSNARPSSCAL